MQRGSFAAFVFDRQLNSFGLVEMLVVSGFDGVAVQSFLNFHCITGTGKKATPLDPLGKSLKPGRHPLLILARSRRRLRIPIYSHIRDKANSDLRDVQQIQIHKFLTDAATSEEIQVKWLLREQKRHRTSTKLAGWETKRKSFASKVQSVHEAPGIHRPPRLHGWCKTDSS